MAEKRVINRHLKRMNVLFGTDKPVFHGFTVDISDTGIFLKSIKVCPPGSVITVEIHMSDGGVVEFQGRIMWAKAVPSSMINIIKKAGMGVKIINFLKGENEYQELVKAFHH